MDNMNIDENTMKNIKNMVDNGNISEAISNISPEMIQNFSKMLSNQNNNNNNNDNSYENSTSSKNNNKNIDAENKNSNNNFDINGLDINAIMKMSSVIKKMNNSKDDPRANLLNSLKPYLRDSKKEKLDNYVSLLNITKIAEIMKENNNENNKGG